MSSIDYSAVKGFGILVVVLGLAGTSAALVIVGYLGAAAFVGYLALVAFAVTFEDTFPTTDIEVQF